LRECLGGVGVSAQCRWEGGGREGVPAFPRGSSRRARCARARSAPRRAHADIGLSYILADHVLTL